MNENEKIFDLFYTQNAWGCPETKSGYGSQKKEIFMHKYQFNILFQMLNIKTICDAPCGDCNWIFDCIPDFIDYTGVEISKTAVEENSKKFPNRKFIHCDIIKELLPTYDLILCRDCLGHFPLNNIHECLENFKKSKSKYLLTTTFVNATSNTNVDITMGNWMPIDLQSHPFNFPKPMVLLDESINMKKLGLWMLN
jgi:hypothetical protein